MDTIAIGFWGAFFGSATLMLAASLAALAQSMKRLALLAALSALVPVLFALTFLGWISLRDEHSQDRLLAHMGVLSSVALSAMLLSMLGCLGRRGLARRAWRLLAGLGGLVLAIGWTLPALHALGLSCAFAFSVGCVMLLIAMRSAIAGDRMGWAAVGGVTCILVGLAALSSHALMRRSAPWPVHAAAAIAGMLYLAVMASALWARLSYSIELREVMAHGPSYDTVSRMHSHSHSHSQTRHLVGAFVRRNGLALPMGALAVYIDNLRTLEALHGRAAHNHALFVCASRLRRCAPQEAELGRLTDDGFLLLMRSRNDPYPLTQLARKIRQRLTRPIKLNSNPDPTESKGHTTEWIAEVGNGVSLSDSKVPPGHAVAAARAISRTALGSSETNRKRAPSECARVAKVQEDHGLSRVSKVSAGPCSLTA